MVHLSTRSHGLRLGYPKSRQQHDATINKLESQDSAPIKPSVKILLLRGIVIIIYLLLGALIFRALENKQRDKTYWKRRLHREKKFLQKEFNISASILSHFENLVLKRRYEEFMEKKEWDYYQSLYFASTVTTTIGYGHITPQTNSGRLFLIIFALIGIPLNILALASVGEHITVAIFYLLRYLNIRFCHNNKMKHINIKVMFVSVLLMLIMLFLGGFLYCSTEDWGYIDSIYYCFVAMATIGFGDLVPNRGRAPDTDNEKAIWFLRALYISIGLSLVSTVFTALSNAMEEINLLLGRGKYANTWSPGPKNESLKEGKYDDRSPKNKKRQQSSEKISYKHKIKKQGSYVMKYKVLGKLKRKKDGPLSLSDWDRLLEEAKSKQIDTSASSYSPESMRDMATKPTMIVLAGHKNSQQKTQLINTTSKARLKLPIISDNDTNSSRISASASEDSSPISEIIVEKNRSMTQPLSSTRVLQKVERYHSSPIYPSNKQRNNRKHIKVNHSVQHLSRISPSERREKNRRYDYTYNSLSRSDVRSYGSLPISNQVSSQTYHRSQDQFERTFNTTTNTTQNPFHDQTSSHLPPYDERYDIILNQC